MELDTIKIGTRIRNIREELFHETRLLFAERCGLTENHLGRLERGGLVISISALNKICTATGVSSDYILYGKSENNKLNTRKTIDRYLDHSSKKELKMYFRLISSLKGYYDNDK